MVTIRNFSNRKERNSKMFNKELVIEIRYMLNAIAFFCCVAAIALWANSVAADTTQLQHQYGRYLADEPSEKLQSSIVRLSNRRARFALERGCKE